jgi:hypothetical protein
LRTELPSAYGNFRADQMRALQQCAEARHSTNCRAAVYNVDNNKALHPTAFEGATLVKFSLDKPNLSYLVYPAFDSDPHPALLWTVIAIN